MRIVRCTCVAVVAFATLVHAAWLHGCASSASHSADAGRPAQDASGEGESGTPQDGSLGCGFACDAGMVDAAPLTVCPSTPPALGTPCPTPNEECEYGSSWWIGCNTVVLCTTTGWQNAPAGSACPFPDAGGSCPATWAEASSIDAGLAMCPAAECQYPEGSCACIATCGSGGARHVAIAGQWDCAPATSQCPSPRPDLGTSCTTPGAFCTYGKPCGCGEELECRGGVWQGGPTPPCP